jgi:hypothetical protein
MTNMNDAKCCGYNLQIVSSFSEVTGYWLHRKGSTQSRVNKFLCRHRMKTGSLGGPFPWGTNTEVSLKLGQKLRTSLSIEPVLLA